ncbi:MAG TPA: kelch repeat-containing protein, partial [Verrucomicrobiae bacterium]|nr:kelch repeat-containing protein [Verrucomicrobiae bacterium]
TSVYRCAGESITLTLPLVGVYLDLASPPFPARYQWLFNGQPIDTNYNPVLGGPRIIPNANTLQIVNLGRADTGDYSVEIANDCGATRSTSVHLQVGVDIVQQPDPTEGTVCGSVGFKVRAVGYGPLRYQWRLDGVPLPSDDPHFDTGPGVPRGQGPDLTVSPLLYSHEGNYDVIVSDECGPLNSVTSKVATLTVKPGPQWVLRATNGPSARSAPALAYDSRRHVTVLFGGYAADPADPNVTVSLNDLWEWNGTRWAQRMTNNPAASWLKDKNGYWSPNYGAGQPAPRGKFGMVYDNRRGRMVVFGGESFDPDGGQNFLNDLWEWDGKGWYFGGTNGPAKRMLHTMAYDTERGKTVLYGGFNIPDNGAVWEWDGHVWVTRAPGGGPETSFDQTEGAMAYDSFHHYTFFGPAVDGFFSTHFFGLDGTGWNDRGAGYTPGLAPFENGAMAYDSYRRRSVWFGGRNLGGVTPNLTPTWDGVGWSFLANLPDAPPPSARFFDALAYDSLRHAVVMFGGEGTSLGLPPHNFAAPQTWELIAVDTPLINEQPASQYRQSGGTAVFNVTAVGPPGASLFYQWYHGDQLITPGAAGHYNGVQSSTLTITGVTPADAGAYHARVTGDCGYTDSFAAILTLNPNLQVFSLANALQLIWSDANVVLEQADAVSGPWTPVPGAVPPFDVALAGAGKFFRLRPVAP